MAKDIAKSEAPNRFEAWLTVFINLAEISVSVTRPSIYFSFDKSDYNGGTRARYSATAPGTKTD
ncbi:MAG: hypothetical protein AAFO07_21440, partial [Bacteroidota bacterium]